MNKPVFNNVPNTRHKTEDGQEIWKHRTCAVVTHIVAQKQNSSDPDDVSLHYIVGKRGKGVDHSGLLNIPCGHIDWNENLEEAAKREIFEEAGFIIENFVDKSAIYFLEQPWFVNSQPTENRQNVAMHTGFVFLLGENEPLPILTLDNMEEDECDTAEWMNVEDLIQTEDSIWAFNHKQMAINFLNYMDDMVQFEKMVGMNQSVNNLGEIGEQIFIQENHGDIHV